MTRGEAAYRLFAGLGLARLVRRRDRGTVFCFHNVAADARAAALADRGLCVSAADFAANVSWIADTFDIVPLRTMVDRLMAGRSLRGLAALTFDDGYRGVLTNALPVLERRALPATIFVISGASDAPAPFWWDLLADPLRRAAADRRVCLEELAGDREAILARFGALGVPNPDPDFLPSTWAELRDGLRNREVEMGVHTVSHRNLLAIPVSDVSRELEACRERIMEQLGTRPEFLAYPYGLCDTAIQRLAHAAGFRAGFTLYYGNIPRAEPPFALRRINVPGGISPSTLECWASGLRWRPGP
jgi:peptidoglycan/xylan/chitin deacetylase (PgdA/CDA1 family)